MRSFADIVPSALIRDISQANFVIKEHCELKYRVLQQCNSDLLNKIAPRISELHFNSLAIDWSKRSLILALFKMANIESLYFEGIRWRKLPEYIEDYDRHTWNNLEILQGILQFKTSWI